MLGTFKFFNPAPDPLVNGTSVGARLWPQRLVAIITKTDAGDDPEDRYHVITFRCEQATVAYELRACTH
jgi:hypothetical protein